MSDDTAFQDEGKWVLDPADSARLLLQAREEAEQLRETLRKFLSSTGHTHGCPVVMRNAGECSALCVEVRAHFGIAHPSNPYRRTG